MECQICHNENPVNAKFCNHCGAKIEEQGKTCPNPDCSRTGLPAEAVYCPDCGTLIEKKEKKETARNSDISSFSSGPGTLMEANWLKNIPTIQPTNQIKATSVDSTASSNTHSVPEDSWWDEFTHWLEWDIWWEIKYWDGWEYLKKIVMIALIIGIVAVGVIIFMNNRSFQHGWFGLLVFSLCRLVYFLFEEL